ncbi:MAG: hypothetical protein MSC31_05890 [Solirubrobacteraceae bacterium MAG38_C4-C5]|nr:hypothetical protein [Candidatus Siliceabacter maunaloa]
MKRDLALMTKGLAMVLPALALVVLLLDVQMHEPLALLVVPVFALLAAIPITRDEIQQAKRRERDGLH